MIFVNNFFLLHVVPCQDHIFNPFTKRLQNDMCALDNCNTNKEKQKRGEKQLEKWEQNDPKNLLFFSCSNNLEQFQLFL